MISAILFYAAAVIAAAGVAVFVCSLAVRYLRLSGPRVVTCPADGTRAAVKVDATHAAFGFHGHEFSLKSCSYWPERGDCGRACLREIENSPVGCLARRILEQWYEDKVCVFCGKALGHIDWKEHKPCLMRPDQTTLDWNGVDAQELPEVLKTHFPVCWNCHIAMMFRREHPELVIDRPWRRS